LYLLLIDAAMTNDSVSRPQKLDHLETLWYEMDMLEYCYHRLREGKFASANEYWLCIEGFLLHYRNLIQFFGNHTGLRAEEPQKWSNGTLSSEARASIQNSALHDRYDGPISRYLCHCSEIRAERDIEWKHIEMYEQIAPLIQRFRGLFPRHVPRHRRKPDDFLLGPESASTASTTSYGMVDLADYSDRAPRKKPKK